jgi:hypothetical protein
MIALRSGRRRSLVPLGGKEEWVTITSSQRSDMTAAGQIDAPTVIPCQDPTSGIRHAFDLVTLRRWFKRCADSRFRDNQFDEQKQGDRTYEATLERHRRKLDTGSPGQPDGRLVPRNFRMSHSFRSVAKIRGSMGK